MLLPLTPTSIQRILPQRQKRASALTSIFHGSLFLSGSRQNFMPGPGRSPTLQLCPLPTHHGQSLHPSTLRQAHGDGVQMWMPLHLPPLPLCLDDVQVFLLLLSCGELCPALEPYGVEAWGGRGLRKGEVLG